MSGKKIPQIVPDLTGINLQTASMTACVPLAWGQSRGSPNLIDYVGFKAIKKTTGKGGSFFGKSTQYDYKATIVLALCEGPLTNPGIGFIYVNQGETTGLGQFHLTLFTGTTPQAPWSYLVANFPTHARGYQGVAYLGGANYDLGTSEALPSQSYEVYAPLQGTGFTGGGDADCALVIQDFLTNPQYGAYWPASSLDTTSFNGGSLLSGPNATTTGDSAYQTYCRAMGWGISPFYQNQEQALTILARLCQMTNTAPVWTGYSLKLIPYGDATITAHGVTYLPPTGSTFTLTDNDYIAKPGNPPVAITRADPFDAYNAIAIDVRDRAYMYNSVPIDWIDLGRIQVIGRRQAPMLQAHEICVVSMAKDVVTLVGQRMVYVRNLYTFKVDPRFSQNEPMDCGTITCLSVGLVNAAVRIRMITEQDDGSFEWVVEEFPGTLGSTISQSVTSGSNQPVNSQVIPDPVNPPIIFEPNSVAAQFLNNGSPAPIVVALVSGGAGGVADPNWGGCVVNVSTDNVTYVPLADVNGSDRINGPATMGVLTANLASFGGPNPDNSHTLSVSLVESGGTLQSASSGGTAAAGATLGIIQDTLGGAYELIGPQTATLTGPNAYNLTALYRGLDATSGSSHTTGAAYGRLSGAFVAPLPPEYIGVQLWFKFQSFNIFGQQLQDISTCTAYTITPAGTGSGGGAGGVPTTPTGLAGISNEVAQIPWSWNANPATDNVTEYQLFTGAGPSAPFGSCTLIYQGLATNFTETGLGTSIDHTAYVKAVNAIGASAADGPADATTSATAVAGEQPYGANFSKQNIGTAPTSTIIGRFMATIAWTFPATSSTPAGTCEGRVDVAPIAQTDFDLQKDGVSVGTARFAASSHTPTLIKASDTAFAVNDYLDLVTPSNLNGMSGAFAVAVGAKRP